TTCCSNTYCALSVLVTLISVPASALSLLVDGCWPEPLVTAFVLNDAAPSVDYTLSLHDALPICDYLAAAFPELNAWERAGADASSAGMVDAGFENQKELTKMQLDNQKEIAEMQNETQKEIAGIQSATSRQNTKDQ